MIELGFDKPSFVYDHSGKPSINIYIINLFWTELTLRYSKEKGGKKGGRRGEGEKGRDKRGRREEEEKKGGRE